MSLNRAKLSHPNIRTLYIYWLGRLLLTANVHIIPTFCVTDTVLLTLYVGMGELLCNSFEENIMKSTFSIRLKKRRHELNMTVVELADACGLSHACISQYENGIREPGYDSLLMLSSALKVTVDYLIGRTEYSMKDLFADDHMYELLQGFMTLSYDRRHMLFTLFEALKGVEEKRKEKMKMTEHVVPERVKYKISGNGTLV